MRHAFLLLALLAACSDDPRLEDPAPMPQPDAGGPDAEQDAAPDAEPEPQPDPNPEPLEPDFPQTWAVVVAESAPEGVLIAADDLAEALGFMGLDAEVTLGRSSLDCVPGEGLVALLGDGLGEPEMPDGATDQSWTIVETRCEGGIAVHLAGGGLLGRQYAAYDLLHRVGARFFHPEQTFYPESPDWPANPIAVEHTPAFRFRSVSLHLTHPLELGDPIRGGDEDRHGEVKRYIDWQIKNLASDGLSGIGQAELAGYGLRRGLPQSAGFSLHNQQQGGTAIYDPDDPRPLEDQLAVAIDARMDVEPTPSIFSFTFNPSEFTELDDQFVVRELSFIADHMAENYPDTIVLTTNHGTAGPPTANFGVRYYDLPQFAPENLGVKVHSLMFYDLFRPAPVYGNEDFNGLYDFMVSEYQTRRLWHFPESAWWLTFDIAVPLYLPITIQARHLDIQGIKFMLAGKLDGHRVFGTGHEWGYWQNEYCSLRMAADTDYSYLDCLSDIADVTGPAAGIVRDALEQVISWQERDILYGDLLPFLVGTDPETEVAALAGIVFHPLPPAVPSIGNWSLEEVERWQGRIAPALDQMAQDYLELTASLNAVRDGVPEGGLPWFDEIRDGIEVTGLRARHARNVYGSLVTRRHAQLLDDEALGRRALRLLEDAREDTEAALAVIARREEGYRYTPVSRAIGGGPDGAEDDNWTVYSYRYLNRTHHGFYFTRIDRLAEQVFTGGSQAIDLPDALLGPGEALAIDVIDPALSDLTVDFGDGTEETGRRFSHTYAAPGIYEIEATATQGDEPFALTGWVASLMEERQTGFTGRAVSPAGTSIIEPLLPGLVFGRLDDQTLVLGIDTAGQGKVGIERWQVLTDAGGAGMASAPERLEIPIVNRATGQVMAVLGTEDAVVALVESGTGLSVTGALETQAIVDALVAIGGFEPDGARRLVAATLGFTAETLPETVPFEIQYQIQSD